MTATTNVQRKDLHRIAERGKTEIFASQFCSIAYQTSLPTPSALPPSRR